MVADGTTVQCTAVLPARRMNHGQPLEPSVHGFLSETVQAWILQTKPVPFRSGFGPSNGNPFRSVSSEKQKRKSVPFRSGPCVRFIPFSQR